MVVKNRAHGVDNPNAMFRKAVTAEEVLGSRASSASPSVSGCCARRTRARPRSCSAATGKAGGVRVRSTILRSHLPGNVLDESTPLAGHRRRRAAASTLAADAAYDEAGIGPDDLDLVECQDTDAARELLA